MRLRPPEQPPLPAPESTDLPAEAPLPAKEPVRRSESTAAEKEKAPEQLVHRFEDVAEITRDDVLSVLKPIWKVSPRHKKPYILSKTGLMPPIKP